MDIKSDPFTEETVTDYDFTFTRDEKLCLTLHSRDYAVLGQTGYLEIKMYDPDGELAINLSRVLWMSKRQRIVRTPITKPPIDPVNPS